MQHSTVGTAAAVASSASPAQTPPPLCLPEAMLLAGRLARVVRVLGAASFRSDSAANLVWGLAKLQQLGRRLSEGGGSAIDGRFSGGGGGEGESEAGTEQDNQLALLPIDGLLEAFAAGQEQCRLSGGCGGGGWVAFGFYTSAWS